VLECGGYGGGWSSSDVEGEGAAVHFWFLTFFCTCRRLGLSFPACIHGKMRLSSLMACTRETAYNTR